MEVFNQRKRDTLNRKDKSHKGTIDSKIVEVINTINSHPDYYTTSSCSGRIILIEKPSDNKIDAKMALFHS